MVKRLIVNADDYGLAPPVSAGIRLAHLEGIVTSTTAMMNMAPVVEALRVARRECPGLGLGVHLVLSAGRPMLPAESVPSIVALGQAGMLPRRETLLLHADQLAPAEVEAEWRAQITAFVAVVGQPPTHLDSHHHSSYYTPALFEIMLKLARELGAAIRMPLTTLEIATAVLGAPSGSPHVAEALSGISRVLATAHADGVRRTEHFESRFYGLGVSAEALNTILASLPDGTSEIMCHPALDDPTLVSLSTYNAPRGVELAALTQPGLRARLAAQGVELISYREL